MIEKKTYQAIVDFKDLQDKGKIYRKGDTFPKPGNKKVEEERLEELLSSENKLGKPSLKKSKSGLMPALFLSGQIS